MGMYDDVDYECPCPVCHAKVTGFQSKSGGCTLAMLKPSEVSNFYSSCDKCGCWIEFEAKDITNFTRKVEGKKNGERCLLTEHTKDVRV